MRIDILPSPEGDVIAWEEQFGQREGRFVLCFDGSVIYRHPSDKTEWFAGVSEAQFRAAIAAWNGYGEAVAGVADSQQDAAVERLREKLVRIGALADRPNSLWRVLLEQAESGML